MDILPPGLTALPPEIFLHILSYLEPVDLLSLQLVSKYFLRFARDPELWKQLCFDNSHLIAAQRLKNGKNRVPIPIPEPDVLELQRAVTRSIVRSVPNLPESSRLRNIPPKFAKSYASWDPSYQSENIKWHDEYCARHAVMSMSWLEQPPGGVDTKREIRGLAYDRKNKVVAPLDDGSVCLWSYDPSEGSKVSNNGRIFAQSKPGLLWASGSDSSIKKKSSSCSPRITAPSTVECVSIDAARNRAFFAVEKGLNEVDLSTLQLVSHQEFESPIAALSEITPGIPLTIATNPTLHVHDPRMNHHKPSDSGLSAVIEEHHPVSCLPHSGKRFYQILPFQKFLYGSRRGPLAVVHLPASNGMHDAQNGAIYVAGREPSILVHDRRALLKPSHTMHSGAHLSSLAVIAPPVWDPATSSDGAPQCKVVACGEYKGKGSLELYDPPHLFPASSSHGQVPKQLKNRSSASSSKLLSVTPHGARILLSDGDGILKWVERDGTTLVRRWNINQHHQQQRPTERGIFATPRVAAEDHVARKVLRTGQADCSDDPVLFWTGEKIGLVGFRTATVLRHEPREREKMNGGITDHDLEAELDLEGKDKVYRERMARALSRQADEVRFVRGLGLG